MTDTTTRQRLTVVGEDSTWPVLMVPYEQLNRLTAVLDANSIRYEVDDEVLSIDNGPETAFVEFYRDEDRGKVQQLLDSIP